MSLIFIDHRVAMSVCLYVPFHAIFFDSSHWPSGHMIRSRPLIGRTPLLGGVQESFTPLARELLSPFYK